MTSYMDYIEQYLYSSDEDIDNIIIYTSIPLVLMIYYYINIEQLPHDNIEFMTQTYDVNFVVSTVMMVSIYIFIFNLITKYIREHLKEYDVNIRVRIWIIEMTFIGILSYMFIIKSNKFI